MLSVALSFYALWILVSAAMHFFALNQLDPESYLTVKPHNVKWGIDGLKIAASAYILFPIYLILLVILFSRGYTYEKYLLMVPLLFLPSLLVGLYQGFFQIDFLNLTITRYLKEVAGLSAEFNGFRLSTFLVLPITILGILRMESKWKKIGFLTIAVMDLTGILLSKSRTGFMGFLIFIIILPVLLIKTGHLSIPNYKNASKYWGWGIVVLLLFTTLCITHDRIKSAGIYKRLYETYQTYRRDGIEKAVPDRFELGYYATRMILASPLAGVGPGGFWRNLDNVRYQETKKSKYQRLDNANNQYLQMGAELGVLGGVGNFFLHFWPLWMVFRIRKKITDTAERLTVAILVLTIGILLFLYMTGPHTMLFDVLWIVNVYLASLVCVALKYGYSVFNPLPKVAAIVLIGLTAMFIKGTYNNTYGENGYQAIQTAEWWPYRYDRNCYDPEEWKEGHVVWCRKNAYLKVYRKKIPKYVTLMFTLHHPDIKQKPVWVKYGGKKGVSHVVEVNNHSWQSVRIPITSEYIVREKTDKNQLHNHLVFSLDVSRTWVPKAYNISEDNRNLGVAVLLSEI
jgi:O-antigen ligase